MVNDTPTGQSVPNDAVGGKKVGAEVPRATDGVVDTVAPDASGDEPGVRRATRLEGMRPDMPASSVKKASPANRDAGTDSPTSSPTQQRCPSVLPDSLGPNGVQCAADRGHTFDHHNGAVTWPIIHPERLEDE